MQHLYVIPLSAHMSHSVVQLHAVLNLFVFAWLARAFNNLISGMHLCGVIDGVLIEVRLSSAFAGIVRASCWLSFDIV